jgi:hypothetical protein
VFLANVEVRRRQNSLGEVFRTAVPLVVATELGRQQEESEKVQPDSETPDHDRLSPQGQILVDSEGI